MPSNKGASSNNQPIQVDALLLALLLAYAAASLFHYVHNAQFLDEYPNMPAGLKPAWIYAAWFGVTAIGLAGYFLMRRGYEVAGLAVLAIYAALGLDGLAHYSLASMSAHSSTMNATIWLEVATAVLLLIALARLTLKRLRKALSV